MDYKPAIIDALTIMLKNEQQERNFFKVRAYQGALSKLKTLDKITQLSDIEPLALGKKTVQKIKEIIETGHLVAAEKIEAKGHLNIGDELLKVYGIGPVKARELIRENGIKSIAELRERQAELLNEKQQIGLKYYEDLLERIPRAEMEKHKKILKKYICKEWTFTIMGSYRRELPTSGDIDVLLKLPKTIPLKEQRAMFTGLIESLKAVGYIQESLAEGNKKFMGIVKLSSSGGGGGDGSKARRIDLMLTPEEEYGYSLLYFTGSDKFNIQMRSKALSMGYTMNEHGLVPLAPSKLPKGLEKPPPSPPILKTEEEIFEFLDMPFVPPVSRT